MIVVGDASPLIALAAVGELELLHALYGEILVPESVHYEAARAAPDAPGAQLILGAQWIRVLPVQSRSIVLALSVELDPGEAEAIALAVETGAELLLMDERRGRAAAMRLGCRVMGVLGVLIEAKADGLLSRVRPVLEALAVEGGFRISGELYQQVLNSTGE